MSATPSTSPRRRARVLAMHVLPLSALLQRTAATARAAVDGGGRAPRATDTDAGDAAAASVLSRSARAALALGRIAEIASGRSAMPTAPSAPAASSSDDDASTAGQAAARSMLVRAAQAPHDVLARFAPRAGERRTRGAATTGDASRVLAALSAELGDAAAAPPASVSDLYTRTLPAVRALLKQKGLRQVGQVRQIDEATFFRLRYVASDDRDVRHAHDPARPRSLVVDASLGLFEPRTWSADAPPPPDRFRFAPADVVHVVASVERAPARGGPAHLVVRGTTRVAVPGIEVVVLLTSASGQPVGRLVRATPALGDAQQFEMRVELPSAAATLAGAGGVVVAPFVYLAVSPSERVLVGALERMHV